MTIKKSPECIARLASLMPDARLRPPPVVDGVIRLGRCDHPQLCEALEVAPPDVLGMFDTEAAIPGRILHHDFLEEIEHQADCAVADRMNRELEPGAVRGQSPFLQPAVLNNIGCQTVCRRIRYKWLEHERRG